MWRYLLINISYKFKRYRLKNNIVVTVEIFLILLYLVVDSCSACLIFIKVHTAAVAVKLCLECGLNVFLLEIVGKNQLFRVT